MWVLELARSYKALRASKLESAQMYHEMHTKSNSKRLIFARMKTEKETRLVQIFFLGKTRDRVTTHVEAYPQVKVQAFLSLSSYLETSLVLICSN